ncbi:MAG: hypothetical protein P4L77_11465 [Sulfuriferula sp.]|nr:hypothetical protein [Sulfuriferula sp.]
MEQMTRTVYCSALQSGLYLNLPIPIKPNSTLNERFSIQAGVLPTIDNPPRARYYSLGNGGHTFTVGSDMIPKPEPIQHRTTDAAAFKPIPFVLRLVANDLTPVQRANYGLRRFETWQGQQYVAYYLKRIDFTGVTVDMQYKTQNADGTWTSTEFVPDSSNLNPTPPDLSPTGINLVTGAYVSADARVDLSLSASDCQELINVANVMFGDPRAAIISEVLLCSGVDQNVTVPGPGNTTFNFLEVIASQVMTFVEAFALANFLNNGLDILLDVGATEPLLNLNGTTTVTTSP